MSLSRIAPLLAATLIPALPSWAHAQGAGKGVITGQVRLQGGDGPPGPGPAVVYVTGFEEKAPSAPIQLSQKDKTFQPDLLVATQGQSLVFKNEDRIRHNVFSVSEARSFDLGLSSPGDDANVSFQKPGVVEIFCNIHSEMSATLLILPNRAYAKTDHEGRYRIENVPAGEHVVYAWHRMARPEHAKVTVKGGGEVRADWSLKPSGQLAPHLNKFGKPYTEHPKY